MGPTFASQLCLDAVRHGSVIAQRNTGRCYLNGSGVTSGLETGMTWLESAAAGQVVTACVMLADDCQGDGTEVFWRTRAAELGHEEGQAWLQRHRSEPQIVGGLSEAEFRRDLSDPLPPRMAMPPGCLSGWDTIEPP